MSDPATAPRPTAFSDFSDAPEDPIGTATAPGSPGPCAAGSLAYASTKIGRASCRERV